MTAQLDRYVVVNEDDRVDHRERLRDLHHFTGHDYDGSTTLDPQRSSDDQEALDAWATAAREH